MSALTGYSGIDETAAVFEEGEVRTPPSSRPRQRLVSAVLVASAVFGTVAALASRRLAGRPGVAASVRGGAVTDLEEVTCSEDGDDCRATRCCATTGARCFEKNAGWASCKAECNRGLDPLDSDGLPWSCRMLDVEGAWEYNVKRAEAVVAKLSLGEKVHMLRGENSDWPADRHGYAGYVGIGRTFQDAWEAKGIMPLSMNDGPQGYNSYNKFPGKATQYPSLLTVAASFSPETSRRYATAIAEEFVAKGATVLLGPDVEVTRAPLTGRSFETISGEDPYLGSQLVGPFVKAVQDHGVIACVKHFLNNNQEIFRQSMDVKVAERTQHEIYLPVFKAAFEAGAAAVMCSYNKVYGEYACENSKLLRTFLRDTLKFKGFVVSDWGATHDAKRSSDAGLDIDMQKDDPTTRLPDSYHKLPALVKSGSITEASIDEKAVHVVSAMMMAGQFDGRFPLPEGWAKAKMGVQRGEQKQVVMTDTTSPAHDQVAIQTIIDGAVLLKNRNNALPVAKGAKVVMVGKYCDMAKDPAIKQGDVYSGGGSGFVDTDRHITPLKGMQARVRGVTASVDALGAKGADVAIVCAAAHSEEGWDRKDFSLPGAKELVSELRAQSPKQKIVVLASVPGAVTTEWLDDADAALVLFEPGEQVGPAFAALVLGDASPGGRLPVSFPKVGEKRFTADQYPGTCPAPDYWCPNMTADFSEGVLVGYRWNTATDTPSAFSFGFGLDYTPFSYDKYKVECKLGRPLISLEVTNDGMRNGTAVPQLYVGFPSLRPAVRQLRGFQKVWVQPGERVNVAFHLDTPDWSFYSEKVGGWESAMAKGEPITVSVGASASDLKWYRDVPDCTKEASIQTLAKK